MFKEIIAVHSEAHIKHTNTLSEEIDFFNVKAVVLILTIMHQRIKRNHVQYTLRKSRT